MADAKKTLSIEFDNNEALEHFAHWLCGQGEQDYWQWMEYREQEDEGDITVVKFDYHCGKGGGGIKSFVKDKTIRTQAGRMDKGWK